MKRIETEKAPLPIGPYSQAVHAGPFLFLSGMLPIDPQTGKIEEKTIEGQTQQVLKNIRAVLEAASLGLSHIVRVEIFLTDLNDFAAMNRVYAEAFSQEIKPARHAVQVVRLPLDALIEMTCTAFVDSSFGK